jgi:hypothetical protein
MEIILAEEITEVHSSEYRPFSCGWKDEEVSME